MPHRISIVLGLSTALLLAPGVRAGDLLQTYRDALANDSQFAASRAQLDAGREKIRRAAPGCCRPSDCPPTATGTTSK